PLALSLFLGVLSVSLGTVMAVVQVVVQHSAGPEHYGTAAANVQLARSVGAALGTALVGTVILGIVGMQSSDMAGALQALIQGAAAEVPTVTGGEDSIHDVINLAYGGAFM